MSSEAISDECEACGCAPCGPVGMRILCSHCGDIYESGVAEERARIVAWLRNYSRIYRHSASGNVISGVILETADKIEATPAPEGGERK